MDDLNDKTLWMRFKEFLSAKFNLDEDKAEQHEVVESIRRGVEFRGTNLWILIFAIIIASVGLNVNSTAVIIGAMLISPLMGPIMGIGMSLGINDFELLKKSAKNFGFAVLVSLVASGLYFFISPLTIAQSEILARTQPTTWDVLIATFGGLAGIVAQSRKDRTSTVIPGVAIATALMPPLCTAGYGLAMGNMEYFFGAFYLFFINAVFIAFATFFIVRFMKYERKQQLDSRRQKRVKHYMIIILTATLIPSVILAYGILQRTSFETSADKFVKSALNFKRHEIMKVNLVHNMRLGSEIEVVLVGEPLSDETLKAIEQQLPTFGLKNTKLVVRQASVNDSTDNESLQQVVAVGTDQILQKNKEIEKLRAQIDYYQSDSVSTLDVASALKLISDDILSITLSKAKMVSENGTTELPVLVCILNVTQSDLWTNEQREKVRNYLKKQTESANVELVIQQTQQPQIQTNENK